MNDTVIFIVLAGLALIFKWLTRQGSDDAGKSEPPPRSQPNDRPQRPPADSDTERVRRFLEALGAPPGTQPPPPVRQRRLATPPPRTAPAKTKRSWVQALPPLVTTPEDMRPLPPITTVPPAPVVLEAAPMPPVAFVPLPAPTPLPRGTAPPRPVPMRSLGAMLRAPGSIRRAIILREVLGPPRGLQAFDDLGSF